MPEITITVTALLLAIFVTASFFARARTFAPAVRAEQMAAVWKSVLALTDEQTVRIQNIMHDHECQWDVEQERERSSTTMRGRAGRLAKWKDRQLYHQHLREVLTPEQARLAVSVLPEMRPLRVHHRRRIFKYAKEPNRASVALRAS